MAAKIEFVQFGGKFWSGRLVNGAQMIDKWSHNPAEEPLSTGHVIRRYTCTIWYQEVPAMSKSFQKQYNVKPTWGWCLTTAGEAKGSTRHTFFGTVEAAMEAAQKWARGRFQEAKPVAAPVVTPVAEPEEQYTAIDTDEVCAIMDCQERATWKRSYRSASMAATGFYLLCSRHAEQSRTARW